MAAWWIPLLREVFDGRRVVLAGAVAAAWTEHIGLLRSAGATDVMIVATEGEGVGPLPDVPTVVVEPPDGLTFMQRLHFGIDVLASPPAAVLDALERFDPSGDAVVVGTFLNAAPALDGRPFLSHRRPEWVALEDKTIIDEFWDRAGVARQPAAVADLGEATVVARQIDRGQGTVWAADAREGFHGGGAGTYRVVDEHDRTRALDALGRVCDRVRVMPFLDGIPCSIHGIVLPDGTAVLRPVEMVTLRRGSEFVYAGCATFWDPPAEVREQMRRVARLVGARLVAEVGFRGTFTIDGVVTDDGFWPTELNPRFGAGINTIARAARIPILLVNELIIAGIDIGRTCRELEVELVAAADEHRGGGTWIHGLSYASPTASRGVVGDAGGFRWAQVDESATATVIAGAGFVRCTYESGAVPAGPSTAPLAARFWEFADRALAAGVGAVTPAPAPSTPER